jgi:hypothetical protein
LPKGALRLSLLKRAKGNSMKKVTLVVSANETSGRLYSPSWASFELDENDIERINKLALVNIENNTWRIEFSPEFEVVFDNSANSEDSDFCDIECVVTQIQVWMKVDLQEFAGGFQSEAIDVNELQAKWIAAEDGQTVFMTESGDALSGYQEYLEAQAA